MDDRLSAPAPAAPADIPSLDRLLHAPPFSALIGCYGRSRVGTLLRRQLAALRERALSGTLSRAELTEPALATQLAAALAEDGRSRLRPVFNLTGTVLHTNLGRALLPDEAVQAVARALTTSVSLEFDLVSGRRGERDAVVEELLCELTGAEAATVVNNNAAAVLLALSALAARREVIVSRGELIEIGGSFRLPDIMRQAGTRLIEVGTTNRTHPADYEQAVGERTALLMKVHTSNYLISGFTHAVDIPELQRIAQRAGVPLFADLGSGSLVELGDWQLPREPTVHATLSAGADLVSFSGDKLLGGPQAGVLVGRTELIAALRKHPLKRALRVGKLTLAALEAVLQLYRAPEHLAQRLPTLRLLTRAAATMHAQAVRLRPPLQQALGPGYAVTEAALSSQVGSGAQPVEQLASYGLAIRRLTGPGRTPSLARLEQRLRALPRPVLGRLAEDTLWLDLRCLEEADESAFLAQWAQLR
jgi:L-seryl-tRNA(Ser) seleniumtransferase